MFKPNRKHFASFFQQTRESSNIFYITDLEGQKSALVDSVKNSQIVCFDPIGRLTFKTGVTHPHFIFGGDLTDRGIYDVELTELLLDFKQRHPHNVTLIVGNRDANKVRFHIELHPNHIRERLLNGHAPFWLSACPHQVPRDYIKSFMRAQGCYSDNEKDIASFIASLEITTCQIIYLKWMLKETLGCPHTFDYHTQYLADQRQCRIDEISDHDVLLHFLAFTAPDGLMGTYLQHTQMATIVPNTGILAIHGGLTPDNIGRLPTMEIREPHMKDAHAWVEQLNEWYTSEVNQWRQTDHATAPKHLHPAEIPLITFSHRVPSEYRNIITASSMLDTSRQFTQISHQVCDYLTRNGLHLVLTGHAPCGDHPVLMRSQDARALFICADTGYAHIKPNDAHNSRGKVSHTLDIAAEPHQAHVHINAQIKSERRITTQLSITPDAIIGDPFIGRLLPDHELVQCKLPNGNYRTIHQQGIEVRYKVRTAHEITRLLDNAMLVLGITAHKLP